MPGKVVGRKGCESKKRGWEKGRGKQGAERAREVRFPGNRGRTKPQKATKSGVFLIKPQPGPRRAQPMQGPPGEFEKRKKLVSKGIYILRGVEGDTVLRQFSQTIGQLEVV